MLALLAVAPGFATTYVAVLEVIAENKELSYSELQYLTDKLRERASVVLPSYMDYVIMTRENIRAMLPPGKSDDECYGTCLAETGKNIAADYVSGARIGKFGSQYTLTVELYETRSSKLLGSFSTRKPDADLLLAEIESQADGLYSKVMNDRSGLLAFDENAKTVEVTIETIPADAQVSIDGKPKCKSTPCQVSVKEGRRNISFALEKYFDKDSTFDIKSSTEKVSVKMDPTFGIFTLAPRMTDGYAQLGDLEVLFDGKVIKGESFRMQPGKYKVELRHHCYEPVSFTVGVQPGSDVTFDGAMVVAKGGLSLRTRLNGAPVKKELLIDGKLAGETPFFGKVPLCGKMTIDGNAVEFPLERHKTVEQIIEVGQ